MSGLWRSPSYKDVCLTEVSVVKKEVPVVAARLFRVIPPKLKGMQNRFFFQVFSIGCINRENLTFQVKMGVPILV